MQKIKVITPIINETVRDIADLLALEHAGLKIGHTLIDSGPSSIESMFDESLAVPGILTQALKAQAEGYDAVIVDCFADPGVSAARELLDIPVFGPGQCSMHAAALLGQRIAVISVGDSVRAMLTEMVHRCSLGERLASLRMVDIPVLSLHAAEHLRTALAEQAARAVREDRADVVVLGCTGFLGCAEIVQKTLADQGLAVPVIDPIPLTVRMASALCGAGLRHSKRSWAFPSIKPIGGYAALQDALAASGVKVAP